MTDPADSSAAIRRRHRVVYDFVAGDYAHRSRQVVGEFAAFRSAFLARLSRGERVADLGAGPGRDAGFFAAAGLRVVALDGSWEMARLARARAVPTVVADLSAPPFSSGSFAGLWAAASFLHVPRPDGSATLRGWARLLRPGGVLGLSTATGDGDRWEPAPYRPSRPTAGPLRRWYVYYRRDELLDLLAAGGFDVLEVSERDTNRRWLQVLARYRGEPAQPRPG